MVLTLYHCPPSFPSRAAYLAARAVGVDVIVKEVDLFNGEHLKPEFIKINPMHTIPTLTDDDFVVADSHAIASYLVRTYGKDDSLYPKDPKEKAVVDQRLYFDASLLYTRIRAICFPIFFRGKKTIDNDAKTNVDEVLSYLDMFLEGNPWVAGKKMTIADICCVASVSSCVGVKVDISSYSNIVAWIDRCRSEMPGYEEINQTGVDQFVKAVASRLQG